MRSRRWSQRFLRYLGWPALGESNGNGQGVPQGFFAAVPLTAYNAVTEVEIEATRRMLVKRALPNTSGRPWIRLGFRGSITASVP